jgi:hypothetical protein
LPALRSPFWPSPAAGQFKFRLIGYSTVGAASITQGNARTIQGARSVMTNTNNEIDRLKAGDTAAEKLMELVRIYETLTPDMELGFTQLTRPEI